MSIERWRPGADPDTLRARSRLMAILRAFFVARDYLEVQTPILAGSGTVDPNIDSFATGEGFYLHTSPEFAMKRLLAAGSGPIFQICPVFRRHEAGRLHNPEFTMLEWYHPGFDHHEMMAEIQVLLRTLDIVQPGQDCARYDYRQLFRDILRIDVRTASRAELARCVQQQGIALQSELEGRDAWLDLLMAEVIGPQLGLEGPVFVYDYPASQAALARIRQDDYPVAERFELYWQGIELANGFNELTDAAEQRSRMEQEITAREQAGRFAPPVDQYFLQALENGLPDCAGVALGVDRLLMLMLGKPSIDQVMSFSVDRV